MTKAEKVKKFIKDEGVFNVQKICLLTGIDRLHMHRFIHNDKKLQLEEVDNLVSVMKKYGFK